MTLKKEQPNHFKVSYFKNSHGVVIPVYNPEQFKDIAGKENFQEVDKEEYQKQQQKTLEKLIEQKRKDKEENNNPSVLPPQKSNLVG